MDIQTILTVDAVKLIAKCNSKKRLFKELGTIGKTAYGLDCERIQNALQEREDLGSTAMGNGVAIPHARVDGLDRVCGVFVKLNEAMEFGALDGRNVDLMFALFAPTNSGTDHLKALARVSRILREQSIREDLRAATDVPSIYTILLNSAEPVAAE